VGKHPLDEENVIIMEYAHFLPYITRYLHPKLPEPVSQEFKQINLYDFAQQVVINLPPPRIQFYLQSDYDKIQRAGTCIAHAHAPPHTPTPTHIPNRALCSGGVLGAHCVQAGL
jgi:hypothetical protein